MRDRVALVHDWLTGMRGGEKVLEAIAELFPEAPIYTLVHVPGSVAPLENHPIHTSFLQRIPGVERHYRRLLAAPDLRLAAHVAPAVGDVAERVAQLEARLLEALPRGCPERIARWRLRVEILRANPQATRAEVDRVLRSIDEPLESDPGLARQVLGAAYATNDTGLALLALIALQGAYADPVERAEKEDGLVWPRSQATRVPEGQHPERRQQRQSQQAGDYGVAGLQRPMQLDGRHHRSDLSRSIAAAGRRKPLGHARRQARHRQVSGLFRARLVAVYCAGDVVVGRLSLRDLFARRIAHDETVDIQLLERGIEVELECAEIRDTLCVLNLDLLHLRLRQRLTAVKRITRDTVEEPRTVTLNNLAVGSGIDQRLQFRRQRYHGENRLYHR